MCTTIQIRNGPRIDSCGELWNLVGRRNVVFSHEADFGADDCLCHVDVRRTALRSGFKSRSGWDECAADFIWECCTDGELRQEKETS